MFRIRKVFRYAKLFGVSRTLVKIKGQYHVRATKGFEGPVWVNPSCRDPESATRQFAIIGCGNYSYSTIAYYLARSEARFLRATFDTQNCRSRSLCAAYGGAYAATDWRDILRDPFVKTVFIASNHASHAEYAMACIEAGKHVHIEKPHVVSQEQRIRLVAAMKAHPDVKVFLGFNRSRSPLFKELQRELSREAGPLMINWFVVGHAISDNHWYFDEEEGGRILGNVCHWTDLTLHLVSREKAFPCTIIPASPPDARSDFVVSVIFADRSCASIAFSAKGHTFEGVREVLNVYKGSVLANLSDFRSLTYEIIERRVRRVSRFRDHGHEANILHSMRASIGMGAGEEQSYVDDTARFFLAVQEATDSGQKVVLT
jgi:predicted dehydrogenase